MEFVGPALSLFFFLAVIGGIAYWITTSRRRTALEPADPGIGTVRRIYFYVVSFTSLMMAAAGLSLIAATVLDAVSGDAIRENNARLAAGLSMALVGLPLWAFHWRIVARYLREVPAETRSLLRKLYLYLVLGVSLGVGMSGVGGTLLSIIGDEGFRGFELASAIVFAVVFAYHWRIESREGQPTPEALGVRRLYVYTVSVVTLGIAAVALAMVLGSLLQDAYETLTSARVLTRKDELLSAGRVRENIVMALVTAPIWAAHWLYLARSDIGSVLRQLYLYGFAIMGGLITVLVGAGIVIHGVISWLIGSSDEVFASAHFRFLPAAVSTLVLGSAVLVHHWLVAARADEPRDEQARTVGRAYAYALAAVGLIIVAYAIATLVGAALSIFAESGSTLIAGRDVWKGGFALGITLALLGGPLWGFYWRSVQRRLTEGQVHERSVVVRRIFIFGVLGAGMLALIAGVSTALFILLRELLDGNLGEVLSETRFAVAAIVPAALFVPYYWGVYREDRRIIKESGEPEEEPGVRKAVTVLVSDSGDRFVQELESILGYRVSPLRWADPDAGLLEVSGLELREVVRRILDAPGENVLLVPEEGGVRVLSYR